MLLVLSMQPEYCLRLFLKTVEILSTRLMLAGVSFRRLVNVELNLALYHVGRRNVLLLSLGTGLSLVSYALQR